MAANLSSSSSTASGAAWNRTVIVCGASSALSTGNSLIFFALDYATGQKVGSSAVVPSASGISSSVVDVGYNNAIFSFVGATTAMLCRIQLTNPLTLITLFSVERVNGDRPAVVQMTLNTTTRTLWLSAATTDAVQAVSVNLFSISIVQPAVFDQRGGVTVTVTGIGFVPDPTPLCDFHSNDTLTTPSASSTHAVFVNSTTLLCIAAAVSMYDASCSTLMLNVWYGGRVTTTTLGGTTRPLSVTLDNATTSLSGGMPRTFHTANTAITLSGFGFVTGATQATCRIEEADGTVVAELPAIPTGVTVAYCNQTTTIAATKVNAGIRYSHDGFVYSTSMTLFAVVGEWGGIIATVIDGSSSSSSTSTVQAQLASLVSAITIETTDALGNVLGLLDSSSKQMICSSIDPVLVSDVTAQQPLFTTSSTTILTTTNGVVTFTNVQLASPDTGTQTLYFFPTLDRTISATVVLTIVPGQPSSISFATGTSEASWASGVTATFTIPEFSAVIFDVVGNTVTDSTNLPSSATVQYTNVVPPVAAATSTATTTVVVTFAASLDTKTSSYVFTGLSTISPFGTSVILRFTTSDSSIQSMLYTMAQETCGTGSYGVAGGYECFTCPAAASCDGTTAITAAPGYWRGTVTSPYLYACSPADSCASSTTCAAGYEGAICGSCQAGYGRAVSSCNICGSLVAPWIFAVLIVLGFIAGVWALALRTVAFSSPADAEARIVELPAKPSSVSILVKIALSHVQIVSLLPLKRLAVGFVASALSSSGSWSVVTPGFLNVACAIGRRAVNEMYATVALAGLAGLGCCVVAYGVAYFDDRRFREKAHRSAVAQRARVAKEAKASPVLFRAADEAHSAALFHSKKHCNEVLRNHMQLLEEYTGDGRRTHVDPDDVQGWLNLEFDHIVDTDNGTINGDGRPDEDFIPLDDLAAAANDGVGPTDGIAKLGVRRPEIWHRVVNLSLLGFLVVTFILYPTVVQAAVRVISCRTVELGDGNSVSVLGYDPQIDCTTSDYVAGEVPAAAVLVAFGAGVPLLCPIAVIFARRYTCDGSTERARQLFFFVTGGYRLWFWEGIVLARKAVIVVVVVLVGDDQVVCIICMWLLGIFLALNLVLKPWEAEKLGRLETLSIGALCLTCLCLAAFTSSGSTMSEGMSMALVVGVAVINAAVLLTLVVEFTRQASNEVVELTGLEISPQWEIDSLRQQLAQLTRRLRRRHFARVADVSEMLESACRDTLTMLARRRRDITIGASKMELDKIHNELLEREKMMHYDWDLATSMSSSSGPTARSQFHGDAVIGYEKYHHDDDNGADFFMRPDANSTMQRVISPSSPVRGVSRQRNVFFFEMPDMQNAADIDNITIMPSSPDRRRSSFQTPMQSDRRALTSRDSALRISALSFRMEKGSSSSSSHEDELSEASLPDDTRHPDIVNPFRQTCFEDNPWDVLVRSGQQREFMRSREQNFATADLGDVEPPLDMDATFSTVSASSTSASSAGPSMMDHKRRELQSRERAPAFARPWTAEQTWGQRGLGAESMTVAEPISFVEVHLPGIADEDFVGRAVNFDDDISVDSGQLRHLGEDSRIMTAPWGDEDFMIDPSLFEEDDECLVAHNPGDAAASIRRAGRKDADEFKPPRKIAFRAESTGRRAVEATINMIRSQYQGAARAFWAVLADVRIASQLMSIQKVLRLNHRLEVLLEELYQAEYAFLHTLWAYEHHVRSGQWDNTHQRQHDNNNNISSTDEVKSISIGKRSSAPVTKNGSGQSSTEEDNLMSLDLNDCEFGSMELTTGSSMV